MNYLPSQGEAWECSQSGGKFGNESVIHVHVCQCMPYDSMKASNLINVHVYMHV